MENMIGNNINEIFKENYGSPLFRYQKKRKKMKGSDFLFDYVDRLHFKCHEISLERHSLYLKYPRWLKNQNATIKPSKNILSVH